MSVVSLNIDLEKHPIRLYYMEFNSSKPRSNPRPKAKPSSPGTPSVVLVVHRGLSEFHD